MFTNCNSGNKHKDADLVGMILCSACIRSWYQILHQLGGVYLFLSPQNSWNKHPLDSSSKLVHQIGSYLVGPGHKILSNMICLQNTLHLLVVLVLNFVYVLFLKKYVVSFKMCSMLFMFLSGNVFF